MGWREFWDHYWQTLGVTAAFAFGGSGFLLWASSQTVSPGRALLVIAAGQGVQAAATAFFMGYLGWNIFLAPVVGLVCGLVALPLILAVVKVGQRIEDRAGDIADQQIDRFGRKKP